MKLVVRESLLKMRRSGRNPEKDDFNPDEENLPGSAYTALLQDVPKECLKGKKHTTVGIFSTAQNSPNERSTKSRYHSWCLYLCFCKSLTVSSLYLK